MDNSRLQPIVDKLIKLGEDEEEMNFWLKIFPDMPLEDQEALIRLLSDELKSLENLG